MYERAITWIQENASRHGEAAELMRQAKAQKPSWYKLLQGKGVRAETLFDWLENLGFQLILPGETTPPQAERHNANSDKEKELEGQISLLKEFNAGYLAELNDKKMLLHEMNKELKRTQDDLVAAQKKIITLHESSFYRQTQQKNSPDAELKPTQDYGPGKPLLHEPQPAYSPETKEQT